MEFDLAFAIQKLPLLASYVGKTIQISLSALLLSFAISLVIVLLRHYKVRGIQWFLRFYIDFFRGTPLVAQLFFIYYGLAQLFPIFRNMSGFTAAVIGLSLHTSAYMSENIRAAINAVDRTQIEAGLACGMRNLQVMRYITLPQAARVAVPTLTNDFVTLIKGSSMAFVLGVRELMAETALIGAATYRYFECYFDAILLYYLLSKLVGLLQKKLEAYFNAHC